MPIYEFVCNTCSRQFEKLIFASDSCVIECPQCKGADVAKLMSAASVRPQGIPTGSGGFDPPPASCSSRRGGWGATA